MERLRHYLLVRHGTTGCCSSGSAWSAAPACWSTCWSSSSATSSGPTRTASSLDLPLTAFNIRWYHVYSTIAFLVANLWNFQLNRWWTFRSAKHAGWFREYCPFLAVGLLGLMVDLAILTLLMHPGSLARPAAERLRQLHRLPHPALLGSADRHRASSRPLSFVLNKIWTFSAVRGGAVPRWRRRPRRTAELDAEDKDTPRRHRLRSRRTRGAVRTRVKRPSRSTPPVRPTRWSPVGGRSGERSLVYLKSLTLRGFKSFASATTLNFEPGITCVVGPNGSGKSNVVDALSWVMGEQGAKRLRGGKMEDVIFAGTSGRAPLGRAEVVLTIDNTDGALPIDYTEVTISRTMFRNGGSEYAINGSTARLLDVQELLSDSGIGREMHVIVGQGQLDSILQATPEVRRGFIEEAAGVLKHRKRKEKALRKLEACEGNLNRLVRPDRRDPAPAQAARPAGRGGPQGGGDPGRGPRRPGPAAGRRPAAGHAGDGVGRGRRAGAAGPPPRRWRPPWSRRGRRRPTPRRPSGPAFRG